MTTVELAGSRPLTTAEAGVEAGGIGPAAGRTDARPPRALVRAGVLVFASTLAWHTSNFLFNGLTARWLGPSRYGELAATVALLYVVSPLLVSIQTMSAASSSDLLAAKQQPAVRELVTLYTRRLAVVGAIAVGLAIGASGIVAHFLHLPSGIPVAIVGVGLAFGIVTHFQRGVLQGTQRFGRYASSTLVEASTKIAFAIAVVRWVSPTAAGAAIAIPASAAIALSANFVLLRFLPRRPSRSSLRAAGIAWPGTTAATFILLALLLSADVLVAKRYLSSEAAGLYASLSLAGKVVYFATSAISLFLFPVFSEQRALNRDGRRMFGLAVGAIAACSGVLAAVYFAAPREVLEPLFGQRYAGVAPYLGWSAIAFAAYAVVYLASTFLLARRKRVGLAILSGATIAQISGLSILHGSIGQIVWVQVVVLSVAAVALVAAALLTEPLAATVNDRGT